MLYLLEGDYLYADDLVLALELLHHKNALNRLSVFTESCHH